MDGSTCGAAYVKAHVARKAEARERVEELLGGPCDYAELRRVSATEKNGGKGKGWQSARRAVPAVSGFGGWQSGRQSGGGSRSLRRSGGGARCSVSFDPSFVDEFGDEEEYGFFEDIAQTAAASGRGGGGFDGAGDGMDADQTLAGFRAAMQAEVATRIAASRAVVNAEVGPLYMLKSVDP
jgi:hypothetical protein